MHYSLKTSSFMYVGISNSICLQALLTNDLFLSSIVCITLGWEVRWWRWSFSFWGRARRGWWVRRSAARSGRRECRSMLEAGNGWLWGQWCWQCWGSGFESDRPRQGGARWDCEGMDRQLAWQMAHLPVSGVSVWHACVSVWHACVCVCVCVCVCEQEGEEERDKETERVMKKRCRVIHINVFVCLCACKLSGKIQTSPQKRRSQIDARADTWADKRQTGGDREGMSDRHDQADGRMVRWRREKSFGETDGWGVSEKKDMAVSQHTQLSRSFCVVSSERHSHSRYIPGKGRCLKAILYCSLPLFLPLARYTPQHRVLIYKNKTKRQYESFEPQRHRLLYRVRTRRVAISIQTTNLKNEVNCFRCIGEDDTRGSACSSHAKSMWNIRHGQNHRCYHYGRVLTMTIILALSVCSIISYAKFGTFWVYSNDRTLSYKPLVEHI